ncbi:hypothetical protein [Neobacillus mesonae]|uniref:hypothetical protein n=1 Tax=Neobacillus mesonae TaxID=1193713 RepID=UPI00203FEB87|nr:hypothetical protein [Neobacillus mesonae]MCM3570156.1 hypothetical protein [Neobacillus mesonae]
MNKEIEKKWLSMAEERIKTGQKYFEDRKRKKLLVLENRRRTLQMRAPFTFAQSKLGADFINSYQQSGKISEINLKKRVLERQKEIDG